MHTYSINSTEHKSIPFFIALISIAIIFILKHYIKPPDWLPIPSVVAVYMLLFLAFDKWVWKWSIFRTLGLITTPDLNGTWTMLTKSSSTNYGIQYEAELVIIQNWREMSLIMTGEKANSFSVMAGIQVINPSTFILKWEYRSEPKAKLGMDSMHYGMTRIQKENNGSGQYFEGDYYTDKSRMTFGSVTMYKK